MAKARRKMGWQERIMLAVFMVASVIFLPITVLLFAGMLPTVMVRLTDKSKERTKVLSVGFLNFAGCFPFLYQLVDVGFKLDSALAILSDPLTIVIIYLCAVVGYGVDWVVTNLVASLMVQKGRNRLENIKKTQEELARRWGPEVSGELPLDPYGFPIEQ